MAAEKNYSALLEEEHQNAAVTFKKRTKKGYRPHDVILHRFFADAHQGADLFVGKTLLPAQLECTLLLGGKFRNAFLYRSFKLLEADVFLLFNIFIRRSIRLKRL